MQLLLLHEHCSDPEQIGAAGCSLPQQQQQLVLNLQSCWLVFAEVGLAMQGGSETGQDPPCSRQGLMGQIWQGCCLALPCPTGDQRLSDHLRSSQPAITCTILCHQQYTDKNCITRCLYTFLAAHQNQTACQVAGCPCAMSKIKTH